MHTWRASRRVLFLLLVLALGLAGSACADGDDSSDSSPPSGAATGAQAADEAGSGGTGGGAGTGLLTGEPLQAGRSIIATAEVLVEVEDVTRASQEAVDAATGAGGFLAEQQALLREGRITVTLRVPTDRFREVLGDVGELGRVLEQHIDTEDVTERVVDLESRIASARTSVGRLRELLERSGDVAQLATVEGELARREADLEALLGQQRVLEDRVALATIRVDLRQPHAASPVEDDDALPGFLGGLERGWDALLVALSVTATALGYALPFVLSVAVAAGGWWTVRRRRHQRRPSAQK